MILIMRRNRHLKNWSQSHIGICLLRSQECKLRLELHILSKMMRQRTRITKSMIISQGQQQLLYKMDTYQNMR